MLKISGDIGSPYASEVSRVVGTQRYIGEGYVFYESGFTVEDIDALVERLKADGAEVTDLRQFNHNLIIKTQTWVLINSRHGDSTVLMGTSQNAILEFLATYNQFIEKHDSEAIGIDYYSLNKEEVHRSFMSLKYSQLPAVIPELYPDIDIDILSKNFKDSDDPILLLYGSPGVGKTTYLKHLLQTRDYGHVAYVKDLHVMMKSAFWSMVSTTSYDLLIFDDLDFALGPRSEGEHCGFVSNLLSYSDGVFNHNRSKIVITTNQPIDRIDIALVRPGRCFDFLVLNPLTSEQAVKIWVKTLGMSGGDFYLLYGETEIITQAALISDYKRIKASSMERRYIKGADRFYTVEEKLAKQGVSADDRRHAGFSA